MTGVNTRHEILLPRNTEAIRAACAAAIAEGAIHLVVVVRTRRGQAWVTGSSASTAAAAADESCP